VSDNELGKLISELAARPIEIDNRRVRWCLDHGIAPFALVADGGHEAWQLVTEKQLASDELADRVARVSFEMWRTHNGRDCSFEDMPSDELEFAMEHAKEVIAVVRQWDAGK
jgi:hypothetical protein